MTCCNQAIALIEAGQPPGDLLSVKECNDSITMLAPVSRVEGAIAHLANKGVDVLWVIGFSWLPPATARTVGP